MQAGSLDQVIYLEYPVDTNAGGELTQEWLDASGESPPVNDWAYIISERGSEAFESARRNATETIRLKLRYRDDVNTGWRIKWGDVYYFVTRVDHSQRRLGELWITAQAVGEPL